MFKTLLQAKMLCLNSAIALLFLLSSCVTQRKVEYLQLRKSKVKEFSNDSFKDYTLKPNDELYIQIISLDEAAVNVFSSSNIQNAISLTPYSASLMSHKVNGEGYLELPVIGKVLVKDKTIDEVKTLLQNAFKNILNQPLISIKLVNSYVSVLGEVRNPGHYVYSQDKLTIFDAISMAGDITDYGNREKIVILRSLDGKNLYKELDLSKSEILASDSYFLQPNDIIYVKPLRKKFWGMRQFPFAVVLSAITTAILVFDYVK